MPYVAKLVRHAPSASEVMTTWHFIIIIIIVIILSDYHMLACSFFISAIEMRRIILRYINFLFYSIHHISETHNINGLHEALAPAVLQM